MKRKWLVVGIILLLSLNIAPITSGLFVEKQVLIEKTFEGNNPPDVPSNPTPNDGEIGVPINGIFFVWTGNPLRNDVYFGKSNPPPLVAENLSSTRYDPGLMEANTMYYWKIVAKDYSGATTPGPIWSFTTGSRTNHPPNAPEITAEKIADNLFLIKIKLTDPDDDNLKSYVVFWDKNEFGFGFTGNWTNGTIIEEMKGYSRGTHQIKVGCADRWNIWSEWGYLEIKVSKNQMQSNQQSLLSRINQQINHFLQNLILKLQMKIQMLLN